MRRYVLLLVALLALWPVRAQALTVRDIVELSRAGLGDDVLLALIEVDPSVFPIDAATLKALRAAGVSDRVIVAMVRSSRTPPPPLDPVVGPDDPPQAPAPQVVVIEHHDAPIIREVQVAYPVYIPIATRSGFRQHRDMRRDDRTPAAPVYWGWGGTLRPDAWKPNVGPTVPVHATVHPQQQSVRPQQQPDGRQPKPAEPVYWGSGGTLRPDAWKPK
jgi:hypothetical protein